MADKISKETRSKVMSAIRSQDTKPEIYLRKKLFAQGLRYRKNYSKIVGHPDIYFPKFKTAIFVNGCFWHQHENCPGGRIPKSRVEYWEKKFERTKERDKKTTETLLEDSIKVCIVWECQINKMKKDPNIESEYIKRIVDFLNSDDSFLEI